VHGVWAERAALDEDPRFARDYVPLRESWTPPGTPPAATRRAPWAADYVRRDALDGSTATLQNLRLEFRAAGMEELGPWPRKRGPGAGGVEVASGDRAR